MTTDQIKDDLLLARKLKVMQDIRVDMAREEWEKAVAEREETEERIKGLLQALRQPQAVA